MWAPHKTMSALSTTVLSGIFSNRLDLEAKIASFRDTFPKHIQHINEQSWIEFKDACTHEDKAVHEMTQPLPGTHCSLEAFRDHANALVAELTDEVGKQLGYSQVKWTICGSVGYNSDVDVSVKMDGNLPSIEEAVHYKTLRDCIHTYVFGGLSGIQLDTECYIPHPAEFNLSQYLRSAKAHRYFQTGEKASVILQRYASLYRHPEVYEKSKQSDLESINDLVEREAMSLLYSQVEALMMFLEDKISAKLLEQGGFDLPSVAGMSSAEKRERMCKNLRPKSS